jgi:hypothetical protein
MNSERLKDFRQEAYELLVRGKDATFELMDAVMTTPECSLFGGIFASVRYSIVNGQASTRHYKIVDQTGKN